MKPKSKIIAGIAITVMFSMLSVLLFAQGQDKQPHAIKVKSEQAPPANAPTPPPPPPPVVDHPETPGMTPWDLPDLSNEQREKIRLSNLEHMKTMTPLQNQVREKKARLQTVLTASPYDARSADQLADELGKLGTAILKEMIRHDQGLRNLLTPDQQVIFDSRPKPFLRVKNQDSFLNPR
jgi:Spy/CpxP family protein refolding chaperone